MDWIRNKKILISGASSGMGAETAVQLSKKGAIVAIVARRQEQLQETFNNLEGEGHRYYVHDLGDVESIEAFICDLVADMGPLDGFVNCVGVGEAKPLKFSDYSFNKRMMDINYFSFIEQLRCLTKKGRYNKPFSVVSISSVSALKGTPADTAYAATKGAMESAVRCLARELANKGIRINTIAPGLIDTRLADDYMDRGADDDKMKKFFESQILGMGKTMDIVNAVLFLLSEESRFITGTMLRVDGGFLS